MKRSHAALAGLACIAAAPAMAQSSVTLWGIVDATLAWGHGNVANRVQLTHSGLNTSRLGFRGVEDLGGGLSASFWLEAAVINDSGAGAGTNTNNQSSGGAPSLAGGQGLTFGRRSTMSLAGPWGELRLGRDYTPQFWNTTYFDPFGTNGVGTNQVLNSIITGPTAVRASNSIGYFLPSNLGGVYGQAMYYLGENARNGAATQRDGTGYGVRLGYQKGPVNASVATGSTHFAAGDAKQSNAGLSWDFGVVQVMGQYEWDKAAITAPAAGYLKASGYVFGASAPLGANVVRIAYSSYRIDGPLADPTTRKVAIGFVHNLSKRTAVYATYARLRNSGGATQSLNGASVSANGSSSGIDVGLRHTF